MSFAKCRGSSTSRDCKHLNAEVKLENIEISLSKENVAELQDHRNCVREDVPNQRSSTNEIQTDNQLQDKESTRVEKNQRKKGTCMKKQFIYAIDCLISTIIVGPMVIAHWRGIWVLMDYHDKLFNGWLCFGLGLSLHLLFTVLKDRLHEAFAADTKLKRPCERIGCRFVRILYTYVFSLACNLHWRGGWVVLNDSFGAQAGVIIYFTCAVLGYLIALRCIRNLLAPPFLVTLDSPSLVFQFPTRYKVKSASMQE